MRVLIIGFGSIGQRHFAILNAMSSVRSVHLVTKQDIRGEVCFPTLQNVEALNQYDYFVISSETVKHYEQLKFLCSKVQGKRILVEKPLYHASCPHISLCDNQVFSAYNLRFHPVLQRLKQLLDGQDDIYYANVFCGQYLPSWRPNQDYRKSYSADLGQGGGVLRDLSHELDYSNWLFGEPTQIQSINTKRSDLEIKSDDIFTAICVTKKKVILNITVDYISKRPIRRIMVHTKTTTIEADVIRGGIVVSNADGLIKEEHFDAQDRNATYAEMHKAVLEGDTSSLCSFEEGLAVVSMIDSVPFRSLEDET